MSPDSAIFNAAYINKQNKVKVLRAIREEGKISRADVVRRTGLSAPTVTRIVSSLITEEQLVTEAGRGDSVGGRPPVLIEFRGEANFVIGIDIGATQIRGVLTDLNAKILDEHSVATDVESGFESIIGRVAEVIRRLVESKAAKNGRTRGIGLAVAGLMNTKTDVVEYSPDFGWDQVDVRGALSTQFELPIIYDNVTRVMALGELWYGVGGSHSHFICVNVGYGIGSGIVIDRKLLFGSEGMAGEFGHITVDRDSKIQCKCGNYGCLEALASGRAIAQSAKDQMKDGASTTLSVLCADDPDQITARLVAKAANEGDELSFKIISRAADYIGMGIAGLINLCNPKAVFIGGGVAQAGDLFLNTIRSSVNRRVLPSHTNSVDILPVSHGANAAVMGAVSLVLNEVLTLNAE